ncbi:MAG: (2Fe-2S) ferredoxin domain-containing protein, partial [Clostridia bacterium]
KLLVCVGSSCHLKGSYDVIQKMTEIIKKYGVEEQVELQASFCLGSCATGVTMKADEILLHHVSAENAEDIFVNEVYPLLDK